MSTQRKYDERKLDNAVAGSACTQRAAVIAKTVLLQSQAESFEDSTTQDLCCGL